VNVVKDRVPDHWLYNHYRSKMLPFDFVDGSNCSSSGDKLGDKVNDKKPCSFHVGGLLGLKNSKNDAAIECKFKGCKMMHKTSIDMYPIGDLKNLAKDKKTPQFIKEAVQAFVINK